MEETCVVQWTANCRAIPSASSASPTTGYSVQHRFSLRYFPELSLELTLDGRTYNCPGGSYFCIPPDVRFATRYLQSATSDYYDIIFLPNDPNLIRHLQQCPPPRKADPATQTMLEYIVQNWHRQDAEIQSICNSFLTSLLLLLYAPDLKTQALGSQFILTDRYSRATLHALDYIEKNYLTRFTLDELARSVCYNKNYLCMTFMKNTGLSIVTYTNFLRIRKAIGSILFYPGPISRMATNLCFDTPSYFSRTFRQFTGISPRMAALSAQTMTPEEKADLYAGEPLLSYRRCPVEQALASMRHIGDRFRARLDT